MPLNTIIRRYVGFHVEPNNITDKKKTPEKLELQTKKRTEADESEVGEENHAKLLTANKIQSHNGKAIATPNRF